MGPSRGRGAAAGVSGLLNCRPHWCEWHVSGPLGAPSGAEYDGGQQGKLLSPLPEAESPKYREIFANEGKALRRVSHPNVFGLHDQGTTPGGLHYLANGVISVLYLA